MKKAITQWEEQQRVVDSLKAGARSKPKVQKKRKRRSPSTDSCETSDDTGFSRAPSEHMHTKD